MRQTGKHRLSKYATNLTGELKHLKISEIGFRLQKPYLLHNDGDNSAVYPNQKPMMYQLKRIFEHAKMEFLYFTPKKRTIAKDQSNHISIESSLWAQCRSHLEQSLARPMSNIRSNNNLFPKSSNVQVSHRKQRVDHKEEHTHKQTNET